MEEGPGESLEEEETQAGKEAEVEPAPKKGRSGLIKILAIVVAVIVAGTAVYLLFFSNSPPTASFSAYAVDLHLVVNGKNSTDPDGDALTFSWNWGDNGAMGSGVQATHDYAAVGNYTVTLTVSDGRGLSAVSTQVEEVVILPTAFFIARTQGMTTTFDATGSSGSSGSRVTGYQWDFGDGQSANTAGPTTSHTYATAGRYTATLTVTDSAGKIGTAQRYVSPAHTTVDYLFDNFFTADCPYANYWYLRYKTYGDIIMLDNQTAKCADYYPWVTWNNANYATLTPSWVYTLYHFDALVTNHPGYNLYNPVMFPVFNWSQAPGQFIDFNLSFGYLGRNDLNYWSNTSYAVNTGYGDGFGYLMRGNVTMDLQESRRIFGVRATTPAQAQSWWYNNTKPFHQSGPLETNYSTWLYNEGNGKYDIYNGFQYYYSTDVTDLNATVDPVTGNTRVAVFMDGWGLDVLMARWFYWGNASYQQAVCVQGHNTTFAGCSATLPYGAVKPAGWMPQETCWCENATLVGNITSGLSMDYQGASEYQFSAWANPGPDGVFGTKDDGAEWVWGPSLMDYVPPAGSTSPATSTYPNSELRWYEGMTNTFLSPGSYAYGQQFEYMVVPTRWNFSVGNMVTLIMPTGQVPWFRPFQSTWNPSTPPNNWLSDYSYYYSRIGGVTVTPGNGAAPYYLWDVRGKVLSFAGPNDWGTTSLPTNPFPFVEFTPETSG